MDAERCLLCPSQIFLLREEAGRDGEFTAAPLRSPVSQLCSVLASEVPRVEVHIDGRVKASCYAFENRLCAVSMFDRLGFVVCAVENAKERLEDMGDRATLRFPSISFSVFCRQVDGLPDSWEIILRDTTLLAAKVLNSSSEESCQRHGVKTS
ncbi:hypothetical protein N7510_008552 [Penicillium lagena]|uniref:uncharacterized protein n=1 Tax=Penicillium lagena TaxID=94218 RepID=UPI002541909C|nr:uncharacterized protein N7510_008552 [Penicillium lagena]KAJ5605771.1 hypothetical protein N7510_008552 [Penicillium lagena]